MPPITLHMVLARRVAEVLGSATLESCPGPYLLGATTPDIRVLTRQGRYETHYFDLEETAHQDSVATFFAANARLIDAAGLNPETRAFVAGYVSHLVMDEQYITGVYRPFFADHAALGGTVRANVMDRLLQFDLDRTHGSDPELKDHLCRALACTVENIDAGFVEPETLERWRQVSADIAARRMDWERIRGMIANHLRFTGAAAATELAPFLDALPTLLDETITHVTNAEIEAFIGRSTTAAAASIERYLACA